MRSVLPLLPLQRLILKRFPLVSYWTMHFDASPEKQKSLNKLLRKDPRVIRATVLKMGERVEDVAWKYPKTIIPARDESKSL